MKMRQTQLINRGKSKAESWALSHLKKTGLRWTSEAVWRWRVYDFWNSEFGIAIEIDGPEHRYSKDCKRDRSDYERSGIIIFRVRNFNESDMRKCLLAIPLVESWLERRKKMGLLTKAQKKKYDSMHTKP